MVATKRSRPRQAIMSMTGFGRSQAGSKHVAIEVEIKSVNHRFLDTVFRLPRNYSALELDLRNIVAGNIRRGRVEIYVTRKVLSLDPALLNFDQGLFDLMLKRSLAALSKHNLVHKENRNEIELVLALELLRRNEIIELAEPDALSIDVAERQLLFKALESAAVQLCKMREREGSHIGKELAARSASIRGLTAKISRIAAKSSDRYREILSARLAKLDKEIKVDADRLASELAIFAERVDISEELSRLLSHLKQFDSALKSAPEGKKFDFLAQEMGRELNTINSKAQDSAIQSLVIEAKLELEKVREQIQNIE